MAELTAVNSLVKIKGLKGAGWIVCSWRFWVLLFSREVFGASWIYIRDLTSGPEEKAAKGISAQLNSKEKASYQPSKAALPQSCTSIFLALSRSLCLTYLEITSWYCINHQPVTYLGSILLNPKLPYTWAEEAYPTVPAPSNLPVPVTKGR